MFFFFSLLMWSSLNILWKMRKSFQIQNLVLYFLSLINLCAIGTNLNLLNYHQLCSFLSILLIILFLFLYFNNASVIKHLWFFPLFNSLNLIFFFCQLCSFTNFLIWVIFPFALFSHSSCTVFASFPFVLLHEFYSFVFFCLYASVSMCQSAYMSVHLAFCCQN